RPRRSGPPVPAAGGWTEGDRADHVLPVRRSLVLEPAVVPARRAAHLGAAGTVPAAAGQPPRAAAARGGARDPAGPAGAGGARRTAAAGAGVPAVVELGLRRAGAADPPARLAGTGQPVGAAPE